MPKHMTIINLACTITKLRKWGQAWKYSAESAQNAASQLTAEHERKLTEHRAAFGARTEADAKIIAGLREERDRWKSAFYDQSALLGVINAALGIHAGDDVCGEIDRLHKERDGLLTQVQDMRAEMERLREDERKAYQAGDALRAEVAALQERLRASIARGDFAQMEVAALMSQTSKPCDQPVTVKREPEVGDTVQLVKRPTKQDYELSWLDDWGKVGESFRAVSGVCTYNKTPSVLVEIRGKNYSWPLSCVEVVTEATHDTEAGKAAAKAVIRDSRSGEIEMCVGDEVEVIGRSAPTPTSGMFTGTIAPIGTRGTAKMIHGTAGFVELDNGTRASIQDVRKVTT